MQVAFTLHSTPLLTTTHHHRVARCTKRTNVIACAKSSPKTRRPPLPTMNDVINVAEGQGYRIERYAAGPVCKLDLWIEKELYAYITAIVLPTGWLHIESYKAEPKSDGGLLSVTPGMLVFMFALAFGANRGCKEVYGLAIRDSNRQHAKLKRYLKRFGGVEVRKVTKSIHCLPDQMLYGGLGMIIKGDINSMLRRTQAMLSRVKRKPDSEVGHTITRWPKGMKPPRDGADA